MIVDFSTIYLSPAATENNFLAFSPPFTAFFFALAFSLLKSYAHESRPFGILLIVRNVVFYSILTFHILERHSLMLGGSGVVSCKHVYDPSFSPSDRALCHSLWTMASC